MSDWTYRDAGVDREREEAAVDIFRRRVASGGGIQERGMLPFGGFAAGIEVGDYERPVVLAACDGIGTKLALLRKAGAFVTAGWDLVAMNVNDILASGADPLLFLDYVAMGELESAVIEELAAGMQEACEHVGCELAGGESAEMPDVMGPGDIELAGFCVGVAEKSHLERHPEPAEHDLILGIPSRGFHANGYSLIRHILRHESDEIRLSDFPGLLNRTRIYSEEVSRLYENEVYPSAFVHVTGGGMPGNLERVLPGGLNAELNVPGWRDSAARAVLQYVKTEEALRTFNMGFGWLMVLRPGDAQRAREVLPEAVRLGEVVRADGRDGVNSISVRVMTDGESEGI